MYEDFHKLISMSIFRIIEKFFWKLIPFVQISSKKQLYLILRFRKFKKKIVPGSYVAVYIRTYDLQYIIFKVKRDRDGNAGPVNNTTI